MRTLVMGDLHGNYRGLVHCLQLCGFNYTDDVLIQLGDVVDGGDQPFECVEELFKIKHLIAIRGNHDSWFLDFINTGFHPSGWAFGGVSTIASYCLHTGKTPVNINTGHGIKTSFNPSDIPLTHRQFFEHQRAYYIDSNNNCFVHGGFDRFRPFEGQAESVYYWDRNLWKDALAWQINHWLGRVDEPFHIVTSFVNIFLGHSSTLQWNLSKPLKAANIYNIDTGSREGKLTIMDTATKQFWQSDH